MWQRGDPSPVCGIGGNADWKPSFGWSHGVVFPQRTKQTRENMQRAGCQSKLHVQRPALPKQRGVGPEVRASCSAAVRDAVVTWCRRRQCKLLGCRRSQRGVSFQTRSRLVCFSGRSSAVNARTRFRTAETTLDERRGSSACAWRGKR